MSGLARPFAAFCCVGLLAVSNLAAPAWASSGGGGGAKTGKGTEQGSRDAQTMAASIGQHGVVLAPARQVDKPIDGVYVNVAQFRVPGVADRAACRTLIRVENRSGHKVSFYTLMRVHNAGGVAQATWMVPSGMLADGESGERLYSCQIARYLKIDQSVTDAWPVTCTIDGTDLNPCPLRLTLDSNIDALPPPGELPAPEASGGGEKSGH